MAARHARLGAVERHRDALVDRLGYGDIARDQQVGLESESPFNLADIDPTFELLD